MDRKSKNSDENTQSEFSFCKEGDELNSKKCTVDFDSNISCNNTTTNTNFLFDKYHTNNKKVNMVNTASEDMET